MAIEVARQTAEHYLPIGALADSVAAGMADGIWIALLATAAVVGARFASWLWQST